MLSRLLLAASATLVLASGEALAHASFDGHKFRIEYGLDLDGAGSSFSWTPLQSAEPVGGAGVEWVVNLGPAATPARVRWSVDADEDVIDFRFTGTGDFMNFGNPPLVGFRIFDKFNELPDIESVTVLNTSYGGTSGNLIEGFVATRDAFVRNGEVFVNLWESMYHHHPMGSMGDPTRDLIRIQVGFEDHAPPIPEPGTWALMAAGLGLLGVAARRKRRA